MWYNGFMMDECLRDAYFAGLLDGEGNFGIYVQRKTGVMRPVVKINMTCKDTIQAIADHFGGNAYPKKQYTPNASPQWHWCVTFHKAVAVIKRIRPYLITKADMADKILAHQFARHPYRPYRLKRAC